MIDMYKIDKKFGIDFFTNSFTPIVIDSNVIIGYAPYESDLMDDTIEDVHGSLCNPLGHSKIEVV